MTLLVFTARGVGFVWYHTVSPVTACHACLTPSEKRHQELQRTFLISLICYCWMRGRCLRTVLIGWRWLTTVSQKCELHARLSCQCLAICKPVWQPVACDCASLADKIAIAALRSGIDRCYLRADKIDV